MSTNAHKNKRDLDECRRTLQAIRELAEGTVGVAPDFYDGNDDELESLRSSLLAIISMVDEGVQT